MTKMERTNDTYGTTVQAQKSRARRTAWALAVVAMLIFVAFILSGVLGN